MADHWRVTSDKGRAGRVRAFLSEKGGAEMGRKGVIFGGVGRCRRQGRTEVARVCAGPDLAGSRPNSAAPSPPAPIGVKIRIVL